MTRSSRLLVEERTLSAAHVSGEPRCSLYPGATPRESSRARAGLDQWEDFTGHFASPAEAPQKQGATKEADSTSSESSEEEEQPSQVRGPVPCGLGLLPFSSAL